MSEIARDIETACKAEKIEAAQALSASFYEAAQAAAVRCAAWLNTQPATAA